MAEGARAESATAWVSQPDRVLRFHASERHIHWAVGIPFMVCYTTALILIMFYNPNPGRPYRWVFSWTHRLSGTCLFGLPIFNLIRHWRDARLHLRNILQVWKWNWDDLRWLCLIGPASVNKKITLPHQGKFNAGEKINFMMLTATYPMYLGTGLLIWAFPSPYLSWLVHFSLATIATPLLLGHVFMATVNPDTRPGLRGMLTGFVDREWAKHHYHHWFVEHHEKRDGDTASASPAIVPATAMRSRRVLHPDFARHTRIFTPVPNVERPSPDAGAATRARDAEPEREPRPTPAVSDSIWLPVPAERVVDTAPVRIDPDPATAV